PRQRAGSSSYWRDRALRTRRTKQARLEGPGSRSRSRTLTARTRTHGAGVSPWRKAWRTSRGDTGRSPFAIPTGCWSCCSRSRGRGVALLEDLGHALAVPRRVAERDLAGLGPLEEEVQIRLPGEPDTAVDLDAAGGDLAV